MAISVSRYVVWGALEVLEESACSSDSSLIQGGDTALGMTRGNLMVTALFLLADLTGWCSCCPGLLCWEALALYVLQVVLSVKPKVLLGVQVSSWNAAALPSLSGPSWCLPCVSLLLCEHSVPGQQLNYS